MPLNEGTPHRTDGFVQFAECLIIQDDAGAQTSFLQYIELVFFTCLELLRGPASQFYTLNPLVSVRVDAPNFVTASIPR